MTDSDTLPHAIQNLLIRVTPATHGGWSAHIASDGRFADAPTICVETKEKLVAWFEMMLNATGGSNIIMDVEDVGTTAGDARRQAARHAPTLPDGVPSTDRQSGWLRSIAGSRA